MRRSSSTCRRPARKRRFARWSAACTGPAGWPNDDLESVIRAILGREELGSTGIGQGVAVPHTRHPTLHRLVGTVALSRRGVDFAALDGEPVDIFFLLVSPQNQPGDHLRALENISRHLEGRAIRRFLAPGPDRVRT